MCTNLRFDFESSKWTDDEFTEDKNFELKWAQRYGDFWNKRIRIYPSEPYQPGKAPEIDFFQRNPFVLTRKF